MDILATMAISSATHKDVFCLLQSTSLGGPLIFSQPLSSCHLDVNANCARRASPIMQTGSSAQRCVEAHGCSPGASVIAVFCELLELPRPRAAGETQGITKGLQHQGPGCIQLLSRCIVLITWVWAYRPEARGFWKRQDAAQKYQATTTMVATWVGPKPTPGFFFERL